MSRPSTSALTLRARSTSAKRTWPWSSRSTSDRPASSFGSSLSISPSARTATPNVRPIARRLMIAPSTMSQMWANETVSSVNSSAMMVSVAPAALPMPSARWPALRPIATTTYQRRVDLGVLHQVAHQLDADVPRGLEAEGRDVRRQRQIVVDRLRHVDALDRALRALADRPRRERRVVAADGDEVRDAGLLQRLDDGLERLGRLGGVLTRRAEHRPAGQVHPRHVVDGQRPQLREVAPDQVLEAVLDPDDLEALVDRLDRRRRDDGVDAGSGTTPDENAEPLPCVHGCPDSFRAPPSCQPKAQP